MAASVGYDIMYAVTLVKMWRIYYIFIRPPGKKLVLKSIIIIYMTFILCFRI